MVNKRKFVQGMGILYSGGKRIKFQHNSFGKRGEAIKALIGTKFTFKNPESYTTTLTEKKIKVTQLIMPDSTISNSSTYITRSKFVPRNVQSQACFYTESSSGLMQSPAGAGTGQIITMEGSTYQSMISLGTAANLFSNPAYSAVAYRDLLTDVAIQGSTFYGAIADPVQQKTFVKTLGLEVHMSNFSTADAIVQLYVFESKKDSNITPEVFINRTLNVASGGKAVATTPGAGANTGGIAGYYSEDYIYGDPSKIPGFKAEYDVLKKMRFNLTGGHTHEQEFMIKMNLMSDQGSLVAKNPAFTNLPATWIAANVTMGYPKGTVFVYAHVRGGLILDVTGGSGVPTYAQTKVGFLWKKNKSMSWVMDKGRKSVPNTFYGQYPYGAAATDQKFVNIDEIVKNVEGAN